MRWYKTVPWSRDQIQPVEVERETAAYVYIQNRRDAKRSEHTSYFKTWQEAKDALIDQKKTEIIAAKVVLERHVKELELLESLAEAMQ